MASVPDLRDGRMMGRVAPVRKLGKERLPAAWTGMSMAAA